MISRALNSATHQVKMKAERRVFVSGVGMTKFEKPGARDEFDYPDMVKESVEGALADAGVKYSDIEQAVIGYCYGESTCGQRALYKLGMTGIPMFNVNNNCATGSSALFMAKQLIQGGLADCVLAVGFEKMEKGSLGLKWTDRTIPLDEHVGLLNDIRGIEGSPMAAQIFGNAGREHMEKYGTRLDHFAKIAEKNHRHSVDNPLSQFRDEYSLDDILNAKMIHEPLTKLQCCPTSDGSAAAIVCSEDFVHRMGLVEKAVEIVAMDLRTDFPSTFEERSSIKIAGADMTRAAAENVFAKSGYRPTDVDVIELHDCFSANELITYEALGLCGEGEAGALIDRSDNTYGGKFVINPSGGLISKGHPLGATGLAQCYELCRQLRGECGSRQVPNAKLALQHNLGLGGACVVGLYRKMVLQDASAEVPDDTLKEASFQSNAVFTEIENRIQSEQDLVKKFKAIYGFQLKDGDDRTGYFYIDLKTGNGRVLRGEQQDLKADCTILMSDEDCFKLMTGTLNAQAAFLQGKLKVQGNMALAMKLQNLQTSKLNAKL